MAGFRAQLSPTSKQHYNESHSYREPSTLAPSIAGQGPQHTLLSTMTRSTKGTRLRPVILVQEAPASRKVGHRNSSRVCAL